MTSLVTGTSLYGIPVYSLEDLVARKMNALRSRTEGKDIWDCYFAIPKCKNLKLAIKLALESEDLEMTVEKSLESTISKLKKVDSKSIMRLTNQYIPFSERPKSWQQTIDELIITIENLQANF